MDAVCWCIDKFESVVWLWLVAYATEAELTIVASAKCHRLFVWCHDCGVTWLAVKFSHTHYQVLGPELIPVYMQSARTWLKSSTRRLAAITCCQACGYLPSRKASLPFGWYLFYCPTEGRRLSWLGLLVTYWNKVPPPGVEPRNGHPSRY